MTDAELVEAVARKVLKLDISSISELYPKVYYNNDHLCFAPFEDANDLMMVLYHFEYWETNKDGADYRCTIYDKGKVVSNVYADTLAHAVLTAALKAKEADNE